MVETMKSAIFLAVSLATWADCVAEDGHPERLLSEAEAAAQEQIATVYAVLGCSNFDPYANAEALQERQKLESAVADESELVKQRSGSSDRCSTTQPNRISEGQCRCHVVSLRR
jgi:hypothetical protein